MTGAVAATGAATGAITAAGAGALTAGTGAAGGLIGETTGVVTILTMAAGTTGFLAITFDSSFALVVAKRTAVSTIALPNPAALSLIPFLVRSVSAVCSENNSLIPSLRPSCRDLV